MAVPSSGQLRLRADINQEVNGNNTDSNVSLGTLADDAGFDTPPDTMQEFYGYVSYEQPTFSGTPTTSNVQEYQMTVQSPTYQNPSGGTIERGWYFGLSTNMTSNTWYSAGTGSETSHSYSRTFTGLQANHAYRIWAAVRDTQSPARFTEAYTSMKQQDTLVAVNYSTYQGGAGVNIAGQAAQYATGSSSMNMYYDHVYYGNTHYYGYGNSVSGPAGNWAAYSANIYFKFKYRSSAYTLNEWRGYVNGNDSANQGGQVETNVTYNGMDCNPSGPSYFHCYNNVSYTGGYSGNGGYQIIGWTNDIDGYNIQKADVNSGTNTTVNRSQTFRA